MPACCNPRRAAAITRARVAELISRLFFNARETVAVEIPNSSASVCNVTLSKFIFIEFFDL